MTKNITYSIFILLAGLVSLTGCNDFLEADNKTAANQTAENYFLGDPAALRVYAYSLMQPIVSRTDMYEEGTDLYMASNKKTGSKFDQYTVTPEDDDVKQFYADIYACVNMANACIYYDKAEAYTAEMKWVRCYCYYLLSQQFGAVPYITDYINDSKREYPKTDLSTLYTNIINELESLKDDARLEDTNVKGVASKRAAKALLAKVYLAAGWDLGTTLTDGDAGTYTVTDTKYFTLALQTAKDAINGQALTLSFEDKWSPAKEGNEEVIYAVQYERSGYQGDAKTGGHGMQNTFGSYYGDCTSTGEKYVNGLLACNPKSSYLWDNGDARYDGTFMTTMYNSPEKGWGTQGYYAYYNCDAATRDTMPICMRIFSGNASAADISKFNTDNAARLQQGSNANAVTVLVMTYPNISVNGASKDYITFVKNDPGMFAAPVVKKFDDPNTTCLAVNHTNDYRDIVTLHVSDLYLVAAEAALMLGDKTTAEQYINDVRARSGAATVAFDTYKSGYADLTLYGTFANTDIDLVLDERARELYAEGYRWMDLRRTRQLVRYNRIFNSELAGGIVKWYKPIPQAEINSNDALTEADQNEGY